jgi:PhoH-like ATPase
MLYNLILSIDSDKTSLLVPKKFNNLKGEKMSGEKKQTKPGISSSSINYHNRNNETILKNNSLKQKDKTKHKINTQKKVIIKPDKEKKIFIPDSSTVIYNPSCIKILIDDGGNKVYIVSHLINEIDHLKNQVRTGFDSREASKIIENYRLKKDENLEIHFGIDWTGLLEDLDRNNPDHIIMAQINDIYQKNKHRYKKFTVLSQDRNFRIIANEVLPDLIIEDYKNDKTDAEKLNMKIQTIKVDAKEIKKSPDGIYYFSLNSSFKSTIDDIEQRDRIYTNCGVICCSNWINEKEKGNWENRFAAIKEKNYFRIINDGISASNIGPYNINNDQIQNNGIFLNKINFEHAIVFDQLKNERLACVIVNGEAGSGKTILSLAIALDQRSLYEQIIIIRPLVHVGDKDRLGYLPGTLDEKLENPFKPIMDNLKILEDIQTSITPITEVKISEIIKVNPNRQKRKPKGNINTSNNKNVHTGKFSIADLIKNKKIIFEPLSYLRGRTINNWPGPHNLTLSLYN